MAKRKRRAFTEEFKTQTVQLVRESGKFIAVVAQELDLTESAVRAWVRQAGIDTGHGPAGSLTTTEREELGRLRREVRTLRMEVPEVGEAVEQIGQRNEVVAHLAIDPRRMDRVELGLGAVSGVHAG